MAAPQFHELWDMAHGVLIELWADRVTHVHMIAAALLPIYAGAHSSLSRPPTAAKPRPKKLRRNGRAPEDNKHKMEGLTPMDALLYPLLTGLLLTGLYYLIKWLDDPALLNKILNWYLGLFGLFAVTTFLNDSCNFILSFLLPTAYVRNGKVWSMSLSKRQFRARGVGENVDRHVLSDESPLPPFWNLLQALSPVRRLVWGLRDFLSTPMYIVDAYIHEVVESSIAVGPILQVSALVSLGGTLYFNLVARPWWLTNIMGFSYSYGALQLISPTTFATGTMVLISLFFYDIYFVFFTPMMITVAKELDIPVKLLIPRRADEDEPLSRAVSMLGLGDIVLPGIMIGLALRFDLHLYYLKKQVQRKESQTASQEIRQKRHSGNALSLKLSPVVYDSKGVGRAVYKQATGYWGERFWLGRHMSKHTGPGCFPKTYFYASVTGYIVGLVATLVALEIFQHGQPALLYLVPGVLISQWSTAFFKGELKHMWGYTELEEDPATQSKTQTKDGTSKPEDASNSGTNSSSSANQESETQDTEPVTASISPDAGVADTSESDSASLESHEILPIMRPKRSIFSISVSLPPPREYNLPPNKTESSESKKKS